MSLSKEDIKAVVAYRKVKSYATLWEAEDMIATEHWNLCLLYTSRAHETKANLVCRLLLEKKKKKTRKQTPT